MCVLAGIVIGARKDTTSRECTTSEDCEEIQYTNCKVDPRDGRSRCLCMDNSPPINGACSARPRGIPHDTLQLHRYIYIHAFKHTHSNIPSYKHKCLNT